MLSLETYYLIRKEWYKDLRRKAALERLVQITKLQQPRGDVWNRKLAIWIRIQLVDWGSKLQHYATKLVKKGDPRIVKDTGSNQGG